MGRGVGHGPCGGAEYEVARALGLLPKLLIGLIEESAKLIVPLVFYFVGRYRGHSLGCCYRGGPRESETMGYGFVSSLSSKGNLGSWIGTLVRGLTSPAGHRLGWGWYVPSCRETQGGSRDPRLALSGLF